MGVPGSRKRFAFVCVSKRQYEVIESQYLSMIVLPSEKRQGKNLGVFHFVQEGVNTYGNDQETEKVR